MSAPVPPLVVLLRALTHEIVDDLVHRIQQAGYPDITAAHHPVFYNLDLDGTRLTVLAARAGVTHQSMGELVDSLVALGYLTREPDPHDRRARVVSLTPHGRAALTYARAQVSAIDAEWAQALRNQGVHGDIKQGIAAALTHRLTGREARPAGR